MTNKTRGGTNSHSGCCWFEEPPGDCDADREVTLFEYTNSASCLEGPDTGLNDAGCGCFDFDDDDDVNSRDFADFADYFAS